MSNVLNRIFVLNKLLLLDTFGYKKFRSNNALHWFFSKPNPDLMCKYHVVIMIFVIQIIIANEYGYIIELH